MGVGRVASRASRILTNIFFDAVVDVDVVGAVFGNAGFPGVGVSSRCLVVVTEQESGFFGAAREVAQRGVFFEGQINDALLCGS